MTAEILFVLLVAFAPLLAISASIFGFFIYLASSSARRVRPRAAGLAGRPLSRRGHDP